MQANEKDKKTLYFLLGRLVAGSCTTGWICTSPMACCPTTWLPARLVLVLEAGNWAVVVWKL